MTFRTRYAPILIAIGHFALEMSNNCLPVVYSLFISAGRLSYTQIGTLSFVASMAGSLLQPLFGHLSDRFSPRWISAISVAWSGLSIGAIAFADGYLPLLVFVVLAMIGSAAFHPSGAAVASAGKWSRQGMAFSLFSVGGNLGAALGPILVAAGIGWLQSRGTLVVVPLALLVSFILYTQLSWLEGSTTRPPPVRTSSSKTRSLVGLGALLLVVMARTWVHVPFITYLPALIESQGSSLQQASQVLFVHLFCMGLGSLLGGTLSDRVGRWQVMAMSLCLLAPVVWLCQSTAGPLQIVMIGLLGALEGGTMPVSVVMAQELWPARLGTVSGIVLGLPWIAASFGAFVTGYLADQYSLTVAFKWLTVPALVCTASILAYPLLYRPDSAREAG